jgi:uncharacterized membrane protein
LTIDEINEEFSRSTKQLAQGLASLGTSAEGMARVMAGLAAVAKDIELDLARVAEEHRAELVRHYGLFAYLMPEWWNWGRLEKEARRSEFSR